MNERYELGEWVCSDGAGDLHRGFDRKVDRPVDIKVLRGSHPDKERRRLHREAWILGAVRSLGLPTLFDVVMDHDPPFLVYRRAEGRPLAERTRPASEPEVASVTRALCRALLAAHAEGVIHGDLRPEVILVWEDDDPIVHGFGRTAFEDPFRSVESITLQDVTSLSRFLAPERLLEDSIDVRADVYGVCAVAYWMLTGRAPVSGAAASAAEMLVLLQTETPAPIDDVAPALAPILMRGLRKNPAERWASLRALLEALDGRAVEGGDELSPGEIVAGEYRVSSLLGRGGMGKVFLARETRLRRNVALKVCANADAFADLESEGRRLARVVHPNVLQVFATRRHAGLALLVTEHVAGRPLEWWRVKKPEALTLGVVTSILDQTLSGLAAVHEAGLAHLDVKPANLVVDEGWNVKLIDFGLARVVKAESVATVGFTPAYCAPERFLQGGGSDPARADLYSFGVMAFELLAGRSPYPGGDVDRLLMDHAKAPVPDLAEVAPAAAPLAALVAACMAKDPSERPASAREARATLRAAAARVRRFSKPHDVLVVDDDDYDVMVLSKALRPLLGGGRLDRASDGAEAIERVSGHPYALVLLDVRLPKLDAIEVLSELRAAGTPVPPVIAMSGVASSEDWRLLSALGARTMLLKPIDEELLQIAVQKFFDRADAA